MIETCVNSNCNIILRVIMQPKKNPQRWSNCSFYHRWLELSVVSKKFTKQLATVGCFVPIVTTRKVMYQLFFPRALARIRPNMYLWNQPIWEPLKSTFEAKLWNKICSMVTMHGTFCQTGPLGSGLDQFFLVFVTF